MYAPVRVTIGEVGHNGVVARPPDRGYQRYSERECSSCSEETDETGGAAVAASQAGQARPAAQTVPPGTQRRADARRNIASIIDAAISCLAHDPDASVGDIA